MRSIGLPAYSAACALAKESRWTFQALKAAPFVFAESVRSASIRSACSNRAIQHLICSLDVTASSHSVVSDRDCTRRGRTRWPEAASAAAATKRQIKSNRLHISVKIKKARRLRPPGLYVLSPHYLSSKKSFVMTQHREEAHRRCPHMRRCCYRTSPEKENRRSGPTPIIYPH